MTTVAHTNRSLVDKKVHHFEVSFYRFDENDQNILGRQVLDMSRPNLSTNPTNVFYKGKERFDPGPIQIQSVDITLADDENSLVTKAVYTFLRAQTLAKSTAEKSFDINVKLFNYLGKVVEEFTLLQCYIENLSHTQQIYADTDETNKIILSVKPTDIDYVFHD